MPCYGTIEPAASKAFWTRSMDPAGPNASVMRIQDDEGGSLLANSFNKHWTRALTLQAAGTNITHFAMMHSDIVPGDWWLDTLLADLKSSGADLVSAVCPIKDQRGLTSVAIDNPEDPFRVHRRLTMKEIHRLPMIFSAEDCGYPDRLLLANTGCWVCDFTKPWRHATQSDGSLAVYFSIEDRIVCCPKGSPSLMDGEPINHEVFFAHVNSEDWNFSRKLGRQGAKVMCTRNVIINHLGKIPYRNDCPWGDEFDRDLADNFDSVPIKPKEWADGKVIGWMTAAEQKALIELGEGKRVLEFGSYCGLSTICLAEKASMVYAVDTFDGRGTKTPRDTMEEFTENIKRAGVNHKVMVIRGEIEKVHHKLPQDFDLAFIDASHDFTSVLRDARIAREKLTPMGLLAFHDYGTRRDPQVTLAVDEMIAAGAEIVGRIDTLIVLRPQSECGMQRREIGKRTGQLIGAL
jgi:hypothetical protein